MKDGEQGNLDGQMLFRRAELEGGWARAGIFVAACGRWGDQFLRRQSGSAWATRDFSSATSHRGREEEYPWILTGHRSQLDHGSAVNRKGSRSYIAAREGSFRMNTYEVHCHHHAFISQRCTKGPQSMFQCDRRVGSMLHRRSPYHV